jgi:short-subunit dehydrogenase
MSRPVALITALAAEVEAAHPGTHVRSLAKDLFDPHAVAEIASELASAGVTVDLLVNNAGFGVHGAFAKSEPSSQSGQVALNIAALVDLSRAFVTGMVERGRGGIINVASTAAFQPLPAMAVYGATKAFVLSFSEALHEEVRRSGVSVVALCPGATATEFFDIAGEKASVGRRRDVRDVVRTGLRALDRNRAVAIDGFANAALANGVRFMPRGMTRSIAAATMQAN